MHTVICFCEYLRHNAVAQMAYKITHSRSIQVELGKVEKNALQNAQVNANQPFKCKHEPISLCQVV